MTKKTGCAWEIDFDTVSKRKRIKKSNSKKHVFEERQSSRELIDPEQDQKGSPVTDNFQINGNAMIGLQEDILERKVMDVRRW